MASSFHLVFLLSLTAGLFIGMSTEEPARQTSCCPSGWTQFGSRCFIFYNQAKKWIDAELSCVSSGGNLASIHSLGEHNFLRNMIHRVTAQHPITWIGGSDAVQEGMWLWSDGSRFDYRYWGSGEPNNSGQEHCIEINHTERWNDKNCHEARPYICAMNL